MGRGIKRGRRQSYVPWGPFLCPQDSLGCRLVFLLMQYCVAANYYWLLVEGVYLYTLLAFSVFSEQRIFRLYLSIGWGKVDYHSSYMFFHPNPWHGRRGTLTSLGTTALRLPPGSPLGAQNTLLGQGQRPLDNSVLGTGLTAEGYGYPPVSASPAPPNGNTGLPTIWPDTPHTHHGQPCTVLKYLYC